MPLKYGYLTDIGKVRNVNQDAILTFVHPTMPDVGCFMVADGMGSKDDGKKAAQLAVDTSLAYLHQHFFDKLQTPHDLKTLFPSLDDTITHAFKIASDVVYQQSHGKGATTLTLAVVAEKNIMIGHAGDCRAFLINKNTIKPLTRIHHTIPLLIEHGTLTWDDVKKGHIIFRSIMYSALGCGYDVVRIDTTTLNIASGEKLMLCSNGLCPFFSPEEEKAYYLSLLEDIPPQALCEKLVKAATAQDIFDDTSVIIIEMD